MSEKEKQRAEMLVNTTGGTCSYRCILGMIRHHPEGENDNALAEIILDGNFDPEKWANYSDNEEITDEDSFSSSSSYNSDPVIVIPSVDGDEQITTQLMNILGNMYPRNSVLEVVRNTPDKNDLEAIMDAVLEQIDENTVSEDWLRTSRENGINLEKNDIVIPDFKEEMKEEDIVIPEIPLHASQEFWNDSYYKFVEEVSEQLRFKRAKISDLLATDVERALAFDVIEELSNRRVKYSLDTVLCVLRHHERPQNIKMVASTIEKGINVEEWFEKDQNALDNLSTVDCEICYMDCCPSEMYTVNCDSKHSFCYDCLQGSIKVSLDEGSVALCPWGGCDHVITEREIVHIFGEGDILRKFSRLLLKVGLAELENCIGCPTPGCENWLVLPDTESKVKCHCEGCSIDFCSICKEIYHYQISCKELEETTVKWIKWNENREKNMGVIKDASAIKQRIKEFEKDEAWKAQNLRCCPKCGRPIEKLEGCDSMKCGKDYHGGNNQKGCGARFNWSSAPKYTPIEGSAAHLLKVKVSMNVNENVLGFGKTGIYGICEYCQQEIEGVGFLCVNCPCYSVCGSCEDKMEEHNDKHIFRVLGIEFKLEEEQPVKHKGIISRLFKAVSKKKSQLLKGNTEVKEE